MGRIAEDGEVTLCPYRIEGGESLGDGCCRGPPVACPGQEVLSDKGGDGKPTAICEHSHGPIVTLNLEVDDLVGVLSVEEVAPAAPDRLDEMALLPVLVDLPLPAVGFLITYP